MGDYGMSTIFGSYFDGENAKKEEAVLKALDDAHWCVMRLDGAVLVAPQAVDRAEVSSRLGSMPRFVRFDQGGVFETRDNDGIDAVLTPHRDWWHGLPHRLESSMRYVLAGLVITVAFVFAAVSYGIPAAARHIAFSLSAETTRAIGKGTLVSLDKSLFDPSRIDMREQERLRHRLLAFASEVDGIPLQIEFRHSTKIGANALALPSGVIVFTDQIVNLAQSDEDLIAIYAHEVGHVARRHAMRQILQASALTVIMVAITGDVSSVGSLVTVAPVVLVQTSYSREFEREADDFAWQGMKRHNIPPEHFTAMLQRLERSHGIDERDDDGEDSLLRYLSTHPATQERIRTFGKDGE
jgi:Zn-dependent protease with chaperone function